MMRSGIPLRVSSSSTPSHSSNPAQAGPATQIPSIRLISATPSSTGVSSSVSGSEASSSFIFNRSLEESWAALAPTVGLAPKDDQAQEPRRKLVPKKSKLSLLGIGMSKGRDQKREERARDLSDVVRRVGVNPSSGSLSQQGFGHNGGAGSGAFEIYVDPAVDPDIGDIVVVKKKKSRVGLDGLAWGGNDAMTEVTNVPKTRQEGKEGGKEGLLKVKIDEGQKWWSIGRGRKDSKEEKKEKKKDKENAKITHKPVEYIYQPNPPRSKTPEPFKPSQENQGRGRFNSLDSGFLLNKKSSPKAASPNPSLRAYQYQQYQPGPASIIPMPMNDEDCEQDKRSTNSTPGLLGVPGTQSQNQGSIALRAMRSVRSLARIGSWAQLNEAGATSNKEKSGDEKKEKKAKKVKAKKGEGKDDEKKKSLRKKSTKSKKEKEDKTKVDTIRQSSSSFEVGALSASPGPPTPGLGSSSSGYANTLGVKAKKSNSLLGLGLPSTMRLPSVRVGSSASSTYNINVAPPTADPTSNANRLSVESAVLNATPRPSSIMSSGSSLRPLSAASTNSGSRLSVSSNGAESKRSSSAASVRWDEEGLETVREQRRKERESVDSQVRRKEREEKRASRESRRSSEGRRRTPLTSVFPEVRKSLEEVEIGKRLLQGEIEEEVEEEGQNFRYPILTIEEATSDGHGLPADWDEPIEDDDSAEGVDVDEHEQSKPAATPVKKARARPLSEQLLGRTRPKPMYEDDEGVLSILDAATNDLAQLINNLDLQATPTTPDMTPLRPSPGSAIFDHSPTPVSTLEKVKPSQYDGSPKKRKLLQPESPLTAKKKASATVGPSAGGLFRQISTSSISSLRPYAQSRGYPPKSTVTNASAVPSALNPNVASASLIDRPIIPWATLMKTLSPTKEQSPKVSEKTTTNLSASSYTPPFRPGHKRTYTPGPEPDPEPVLQPLRPARSKSIMADKSRLLQLPCSPDRPKNITSSRSSSRDGRGSMDNGRDSGSLTPVFTKMGEESNRRSMSPGARLNARILFSSSSSRSSKGSRGSRSSYGSQIHMSMQEEPEEPLPISARRQYGMKGTLGGSDTSCYRLQSDMDASDPDSDVPDELRVILAGSSDRGSFVEETNDTDHFARREEDLEDHMQDSTEDNRHCDLPASLALELPPLPTFQASLIDAQNIEHHLDLGDDPSSPTSENENDTNKSFDFTGELQKLNSSGASDRRSFVEQLENAFRTPAKVDLRYALDLGTVPPVPTLDLARYEHSNTMDDAAEDSDMTGMSGDSGSGFEYGLVPESVSQLVDMNLPGLSLMDETEEKRQLSDNSDSKSNSHLEMVLPSDSRSKLVDVKEPSNLHDNSSFEDGNVSRTSDGELNTSFRFGGLPRDNSPSTHSNSSKNKPLTLSDIIPSPAHARALSVASIGSAQDNLDSFMLDGLEDDSVLKSIYAKIVSGPMVNGPDRDEEKEQVRAKTRPTRQEQRDSRRSIYKAASRPTSGISFEGFSSFDEVRRGFEFSHDRPAFYPPPVPNQSASLVATDFSFSFVGSNASENVSANIQGRRVAPHRRHESAMSFASISSYGHVVLNPGSHDPFDYAQLPSLRERPSSEDMTSSSLGMGLSSTVDDTFAYRANQPRRRVDSDASSFYFKAPAPLRGHRRRESNMSVSSQAPPISMYNRSYGHHRRNDSTASASSVAMSYIKHGANGGISAWSRHRRMESNMSVDSIMSDFSAMRLGRPGIGDKMFDNLSADGFPQAPLTAISASPPESARSDQEDFTSSSQDYQQGRLSSMSQSYPYDSIIDVYDEEHRTSMEDSLFEKTGYQRSSMMSDSVFGDNDADEMERYYRGHRGGLFAPGQHRPLSILSRNSVHSPMKEDDTMISMLGGGHVRRRSIGSIVETSPCARVEKRKHSAVVQGLRLINGKDNDYSNVESPNKARIVEKPSIASTSSFQFGGERMIKAQRGLLERQSLEESCLIADGEEIALASATLHTIAMPVFTRPGPPGRSRSSTCTSSSSGGDTPPLSIASDVSSLSGGSQSSIDLSQINIALANATHPMSSGHSRTTGVGPRTRARAPGTGHRRRYSKAHMSRSSVYETIEEELVSSASSGSANSSPSHSISLLASTTKKLGQVTTNPNKEDSPTTRQSIYVVDSDTASLGGMQGGDGDDYTTSTWDDERGIVALRKFFALKDEAQVTVNESRRIWKDTPFSMFAIQSFQAPGSPAGMQALLQHSVQNYGPLPSELRPYRVRSRTNSRTSPYPKLQVQNSRVLRTNPSPDHLPVQVLNVPAKTQKTPGRALQDVTVNPNTAPKTSGKAAPPSLDALKPFSPLSFEVDVDAGLKLAQAAINARPRVGSNARRTALGWSKRSNGPSVTNATGTGKKVSTGQKENPTIAATGAGSIMTPGETLRLNRPRPRGRPTPGGRTPASVRPLRI